MIVVIGKINGPRHKGATMHHRLLISATITALALPVYAQPLDIGKWLVDLGRDYPLSSQASLSQADAQITLAFMQAVTRIDPQLAEGYYWQYDLLLALDRTEEARKNLAEYIGRQPKDVTAHLNWLSLAVDALQTAEERETFCRKYLEQPKLPDEVISELHLWLANYHHNRSQSDRAKIEATAAVRHDQFNLTARNLLDILNVNQPDIITHINELLAALTLNPGDISLTWELADMLSLVGMPLEADHWYEHAAHLHDKLMPDRPAPALLTARGRAMIDAGQLERADALLKKALSIDPQLISAHILLAQLAKKKNNPDSVRKHLETATIIYKSALAQNEGKIDAHVLAEIAWFFAHYNPHPSEAEQRARAALEDLPESIVARRALGAVLRKHRRFREARETLNAPAKADLWSAIELAQTLYADGDKKEAAEQLRRAATQPATGEQRRTVANLMSLWQTKPAASQPATQNIKTALDTFDRRILDYPIHPEKYLALSVKMPTAALGPARPWWCTITLTNIGPFAVTIGPDSMICPDLACTIQARSQQKQNSKSTIHISLNKETKLKPAQSLKVTQTIDIGRIRASMIGTPQMAYDVEVTAVLCPVAALSENDEEIYLPDVGGLTAKSPQFSRTPFVPDTRTLQQLINRSRSPNINERIEATELLAMLLAEHQHITARRLAHRARPINADLVQAAVLARANDDNWQVRARLAETMRWFVLDNKATNVGAKLLSDKNWLVRGLTLRMLTDHYGQNFKNVLERYARADSDQWVRNLAKSLLARTTATTTQPAETK